MNSKLDLMHEILDEPEEQREQQTVKAQTARADIEMTTPEKKPKKSSIRNIPVQSNRRKTRQSALMGSQPKIESVP